MGLGPGVHDVLRHDITVSASATTAAPRRLTSVLGVPLPYEISYRALVPESLDGLLAAGRCISVDREALGSVRSGVTCGVTGQAAGRAAALAADRGISPRTSTCKPCAGCCGTGRSECSRRPVAGPLVSAGATNLEVARLSQPWHGRVIRCIAAGQTARGSSLGEVSGIGRRSAHRATRWSRRRAPSPP